jgi:hypothetical protein
MEIFDDTNHNVTKFFTYLHTMEIFIYKDLKYASRNKDKKSIRSLGPYAMCLSYILGNI